MGYIFTIKRVDMNSVDIWVIDKVVIWWFEDYMKENIAKQIDVFTMP
ncbi:MAG: hypothetical protein RR409_01725 [Clostridium sp.]